MNDMLSINATQVRKDWSQVVDNTIRRRPTFIKRTRDHLVLTSAETFSAMLENLKYQASQYREPDGSVTLSLDEMDLVVHATTLAGARRAMAEEILEYAEEYYASFELYYNAPDRRRHLPYVMKALTAVDTEEVEAAILCHDGKS